MDESWADSSECLVLAMTVGPGVHSGHTLTHHHERGAALAQEVKHHVPTELVGEHELHEALIACPSRCRRRPQPLVEGRAAVSGELPGRRAAISGRSGRCHETELVEVAELRVELPVAHPPELLDGAAGSLADLVAVPVLQRQEAEDRPARRRQVPNHYYLFQR